MAKRSDDPLERFRALCLALPEATERLSHAAPAFFVGKGKQFAHLWPESHHDAEFPHFWCAAPPGMQEELVEADPDVFFRPPYVGYRGWVAGRLDRDLDWDQVSELLAEAYRTVAPMRLARLLDERG